MRTSPKGFTLIELLATLVVVAVLMGLIAQVLNQFSRMAADEIVVLSGVSESTAPSFSEDVKARRLHSFFIDDLSEFPFAYVVGGNRVSPANTSLTGTALVPLTSTPTLTLSEFPTSCREFEAETSTILPQYSASSRQFADEEFSVVFLRSRTELHSVYHVYKSQDTFEGETYNRYEVIYQPAGALSDSLSYSFAIKESEDNFINPVGATHRYHRYDPAWGIEEQDSVLVVFPDPILTSTGLDMDGNPIDPVSRFTYEIIF